LLAFRDSLVQHVGGRPNAAQAVLIDRCVMLTMHLNRLDESAVATGGMLSEHATKTYLAWTGALGRTMRLLGLKAVAERPKSLAEILAETAQTRPVQPAASAPRQAPRSSAAA